MNPHHITSIRRLIFSCMFLVPAVPFLAILMIGYFYFSTSLENGAVSFMQRVVSDQGRIIDAFLAERKADLEFVLQYTPSSELQHPEALSRILGLLRKKSTAFVDLGVFDESGLHIAYEGPYALAGKNYKDSDWFKEVMSKGTYISDVFMGYRQVPHFIIAVMRSGGNKKWILRATIDTEFFSSLVESVRIGDTGEVYLLNAKGTYQTISRGAVDLMQKDDDAGKYPVDARQVSTFIQSDARGSVYLYAVMDLEEKNWRLVARQEKADAFRTLRAAAHRIILTAVTGGLVIFLAAFGLTRYIVSKIIRIGKEKDALEKQLIRASRLAELGEMSAGFAHEVNNPLQIMKSELGLIQLLWEDLLANNSIQPSEDTVQIEDCLNQLQLQIDRCGNITHGILQFARHGTPNPQTVDLTSFITQVALMVTKRAAVNGITLNQKISETSLPVFADPGQLQQVLLNLINNAMDAALEKHEGRGGLVEIRAGEQDAGMIEVSVHDNGMGIREENKKRVFTPFFTTKPVGKGTGLGLSVCYGIIESMGGTMNFSSGAGEGSIFNIVLPRNETDGNMNKLSKGEGHAENQTAGGG